jgi:antitoxin ParD1/3/4
MPTRNVNLTDHFDQFIESGITSGRFSNASEVVREGLRLLEQREREDAARIEWLRTAVKQAADSVDRGEGIEFETMDDLASYVRQVGREVSGEMARDRKRG